MSSQQLISLGIVAIAVAAPVLWAALGELVAEQGGIINPGIEGVMVVGALVATIGYHHTHSLLLAALAAVGAGLVCGALFAYLFVDRGTNQIVTGILFNLLAIGATTAIFVKEDYLARSRVQVAPDLDVPLLGDLPVIGEVAFRQDAFVYGSLVAVVLVYVLMRRTWLGLMIRAAGEHPRAVEAAGHDVWRVRRIAVIIGCVLPAVGGAVLVLSIVGGFNVGLVSGQGFIALGIVVLARWNPFAVVAGSLLFGIAQALQFQAQDISLLAGVPIELWLALPYLVTIVAVLVTRSSVYPRAAATPYLPPPRRRDRRLRLPGAPALRRRGTESLAPATVITQED